MIEEIFKNMYRVTIPLPGSPLNSVNSYMIKGEDRNLIIDTGWDQKPCVDAMMSSLSELKIDLGKTDFFVTHLHIDHLGLVSKLATHSSTIYFNKIDAHWIQPGFPWDDFIAFGCKNGFPEKELRAAVRHHPGFKYGVGENFPLNKVERCNGLEIVDFEFKCIETPGHARGHLCLYEPNRKVLLSGDHILKRITPSIQVWSDEEDALRDYLRSLERIYDLDVQLVLPGHGRVFKKCRERIEELKHHHEERLQEIITILGEGARDAFQMASLMEWNFGKEYSSWDRIPALQKCFAAGESMAHLKYLEGKGAVRKEVRNRHVVFSLNERKWNENS